MASTWIEKLVAHERAALLRPTALWLYVALRTSYGHPQVASQAVQRRLRELSAQGVPAVTASNDALSARSGIERTGLGRAIEALVTEGLLTFERCDRTRIFILGAAVDGKPVFFLERPDLASEPPKPTTSVLDGVRS